jgi:hypothetical protein
MTGHPIRNATIHVFKRIDAHDGGSRFVAMFAPYKTYPVFFYGSTENAAVDAAEAMRTDAIYKHEAACIARQENAVRAKAAAAAKRAKKETA